MTNKSEKNIVKSNSDLSVRDLLKGAYHSSNNFIIFAIFLAYFGFGKLALALATISQSVAPVWPPTGIGIASVLLFGWKGVVGVALGAFVTNWTLGTPYVGLISITFGNTAESFVGAYLYQTIINKKNERNTLNSVVALFASTVCSALVSAIVGILILHTLQIIPAEKVAMGVFTWWSGDAVGGILFIPLILNLLNSEFKDETQTGSFSMSLLYFIPLGILVSTFVFNLNQTLFWIICPIIFFLSCIVSRATSTGFVVFLAAVSVYMVKSGKGHFEIGNANSNILNLQMLIFSFSVSANLATRTHLYALKKLKALALIGIFWAALLFVLGVYSNNESELLKTDLEHTIDGVFGAANEEVEHYQALLMQTVGTLRIKGIPTPGEWRVLTNALDLSKNFQAVLGLGFVNYVKKSNHHKFIKDVLASGQIPEFKTRDLSPEYSAQFDDEYIIRLIEPLKENNSALGLNLGSEQLRREAIEKARKSSQVVATAPIKLVQDKKSRPGFLMLFPFNGGRASTGEKFLGLAYSPVIYEVFFNTVFHYFSNYLSVKVVVENQLVFEKGERPSQIGENNPFLVKRDFEFFGQRAKIEFYPTQSFFSYHKGVSLPVSCLLTIILLLGMAFYFEMIITNSRLVQAVNDKAKEIDGNRARLTESAKFTSLGEMAAGMAHEINNPLAIIAGNAEILKKRLSDDGDNRAQISNGLDRIIKVTHRIAKIIKGLKSISRNADKDPMETASTATIISDALELCSERFKVHSILVETSLDNAGQVFCRPTQISQVILNLLNNSFDAVQSLSDKWIKVEVVDGQDTQKIMVTDSGSGIPLEVRNKMLQPFFTTKGVGKGTGLGLSIAKGIIEDHGGKLIYDESCPNTRFIIELPKPVSTNSSSNLAA